MNFTANKIQSALFAAVTAVVSLACIFVGACAFVVTVGDCQVLGYCLRWQIRVYFAPRPSLTTPRESNDFLGVCSAAKND